jgi:hypothetical protein
MFRAVFLPIIRNFLAVHRHLYILCNFGDRVLPGVPSCSWWQSVTKLHKLYQWRTAKNSWWWAERLPETCRVVIPIKLELSASVGFIQKECLRLRSRLSVPSVFSFNNLFQKAVPTQYLTNPVSPPSFSLYIGHSSPPCLFVTLIHFSHDRSNCFGLLQHHISKLFHTFLIYFPKWPTPLNDVEVPFSVLNFIFFGGGGGVVVHPSRSHNNQHLLTIPTKRTMFIHYISYTCCTSATCFDAECTIFRENFCTAYLNPDIVVKLFSVVAIVFNGKAVP